jgi:hypothetical protein
MRKKVVARKLRKPYFTVASSSTGRPPSARRPKDAISITSNQT